MDLFKALLGAVELGANVAVAHATHTAGKKAARRSASGCTPCAANAALQQHHGSLNAARKNMGLKTR